MDNADKLSQVDVTKLKSPKKKINFDSNKWTYYFLDQSEIDFIQQLIQEKTVHRLGEYAVVEVGITTGSNQFFTVPQSVVQKYNLHQYAKPLVGRSVQIPSTIFTKSDWKENVRSKARAFFLKFPPIEEIRQKASILQYLNLGENEKINNFYKCRIRDEWHIVPSTWISKGLFQRRNNIYPKFVLNRAEAYTTDTTHRVKIHNTVSPEALVASYYNSLSFAFAEICGRSHGGGALELMPNEVENIIIPYRVENAKLIKIIDQMMRSGKRIEDILDKTDPIILNKGYGFTDKEIMMARRIWQKLLNRRMNRGKK